MDKYKIHIKDIEINNYRLFRQIQIQDFDESINCFLGQNGSGKTSILEAINIALSDNSSKFNNIKETDFYSDDPITIKIRFSKYFYLIDEDGSSYKRVIPCDGFTKEIKKRERKSPGDFFSPEYQITTTYNYKEFSRLSDKEYQDFYKDILGKLPERYIPVTELHVDNSSGELQYGLKSEQATRTIPGHAVYSLETFMFPQVFYFDKDRDRELLSGYNTAYKKIIGELNWRFRRELKKDPAIKKEVIDLHNALHEKITENTDYIEEIFNPVLEILNNHLNLDFDLSELKLYLIDNYSPYSNSHLGIKTDQHKVIDVEKFGSGVTILISCALLISLATKSNTPIIICIDEPELHLHANLQKNLYKLLEEGAYQAFLATHSHLFICKSDPGCNYSCKFYSGRKPIIEKCTQLNLANTLFGILGNELTDLYIPENLCLVEGKYDKQILNRTSDLLGFGDKTMILVNCGGDQEVKRTGEGLQIFFDTYLVNDSLLSRYVSNKFKFVVDGDVLQTKFEAWKRNMGLDDHSAKKLDYSGIEYLFPETLIKELVKDIPLKDGGKFDSLSKDEIIETILKEEDFRNDPTKKDVMRQNQDTAISKQRLNEYILENITIGLLCGSEGTLLKELTEWLFS